MIIQRYAVVVEGNRGGTEVHTTNLPYKRAVALAKQLVGPFGHCQRYYFDLETGRRRRRRKGTTVYTGDALVMVEALAPQVLP